MWGNIFNKKTLFIMIKLDVVQCIIKAQGIVFNIQVKINIIVLN